MKTPIVKDYHRHPCFNAKAKGQYGRVHLPVAPKCNIKCNFCDRKYDCVNESRPGVTSNVLTPEQASIYVDRVLEKEPRITVAGIAGPGDPFANGEETMETMRLIKKNHQEMILCLSSNGMNIGPYIEELAELQISHVTITVCAVDPEIGKEVYSWVKDGKIIYRGKQAAELLLSRQLAAIKKLKEHDITVKVNCIVIPGVNDHHIEEVAITMKELGVDLFNSMALFPNVNTPFGNIEQPSKATMEEIRKVCEQYLPQMRHCTRCRADAVGLLGQDKTDEFRSCLTDCTTIKPRAAEKRPYVAVASLEGVLINQHLGEAEEFEIWEQAGDTYRKIDSRKSAEAGGGIKRWHQLAKILSDCKAVLISGVGATPKEILIKSGVKPVEASGFIEDGLEVVFKNKTNTLIKGRKTSCADGTCTGTGMGCG